MACKPRKNIEVRVASPDMTEAFIKAGKVLIQHIELETCLHEDTYRGGTIWTICKDCGMKWADDEGGFVPHEYPKAVQEAFDVFMKSGLETK